MTPTDIHSEPPQSYLEALESFERLLICVLGGNPNPYTLFYAMMWAHDRATEAGEL